jgi:nucleoid DNA-binding protein
MVMLTGEPKGVCSLQYDALMAAIEYELMQGNQVDIPLVGCFEVKDSEKKLSKNLSTGDYNITPPRRYVRFRFNAMFRWRVKNLTDEWTPPY